MTEGALRFSGGLFFYRVCEKLCGLNLSMLSELPCPQRERASAQRTACTTYFNYLKIIEKMLEGEEWFSIQC